MYICVQTAQAALQPVSAQVYLILYFEFEEDEIYCCPCTRRVARVSAGWRIKNYLIL